MIWASKSGYSPSRTRVTCREGSKKMSHWKFFCWDINKRNCSSYTNTILKVSSKPSPSVGFHLKWIATRDNTSFLWIYRMILQPQARNISDDHWQVLTVFESFNRTFILFYCCRLWRMIFFPRLKIVYLHVHLKQQQQFTSTTVDN